MALRDECLAIMERITTEFHVDSNHASRMLTDALSKNLVKDGILANLRQRYDHNGKLMAPMAV